MTISDTIQLDIQDPVAIVRLDRPEKLNAFTYDMLADLRAAIASAVDDTRVVGIVITGNGRGFCAGLDAQTLSSVTASGGKGRQEFGPGEIPGLFTYLLDVPKPIVAAVNGVAVGGGLVLAAMCDVRFASKAASFSTIFLKRGLIAEHGMTWMLPRLLGTGRALDILWTSDRLDAQRANDIGLVEYLSEPDRVVDDACDFVRRIAANASPESVAVTKRLVYRHFGVGYPEALHETEAEQVKSLTRSDTREGVQALLEKREPRFDRIGTH